MRHWPLFLLAAILIALLGILSEFGIYSEATGKYLEGPIWLGLFLLIAKEFERLNLKSNFFQTVFWCFAACFLAETMLRLPILATLTISRYFEPIVRAGWAVTCVFILHALYINVHQANQSQRLWRAMFEAAEDNVFVKDASLRYTHVNKSMAQLFAANGDSLIGATDTEIFGDRVALATSEEDRQVLRGQTVEAESTVPVAGEPRTFHVVKVPLRDEHDEVVGITGIARDITKRREIESQLESTQFSLDHAVDLVLWVGEDGEVVYANEAARELVGSSRIESGIGEIDARFTNPQSWQQGWLDTLEKESVQYETRFRTAAGESVSMEVSAYHFFHGEHNLMCIFARDISVRKRLQAEAHQRLADLSHLSRVQTAGEMVAGLAHELNQPLATAANYAYLVVNSLLPKDASELDQTRLQAIREKLEIVCNESLRAGEIIRRLRSLINKRNSPRVRTEMNNLVKDTLDLFDSQWNGRSPIVQELSPESTFVEIDEIQIQQILLNLLTNARDSMRENDAASRLCIRTEVSNGQVVVSLEDNGVGLPDDPEKLFEPFVSMKHEGMGLGLAISRSIAEAHHGKLTARNSASGGAIFQLTLPYIGETSDDSLRPVAQSHLPKFSGESKSRRLSQKAS